MPPVLVSLLWSLLAAFIAAIVFRVAGAEETAGVAALLAFVLVLFALVGRQRHS